MLLRNLESIFDIHKQPKALNIVFFLKLYTEALSCRPRLWFHKGLV